jgi:GH25 family lysozyme M1 (1,4-beta-N-acetylmuramidase)
VNYHQLKQWLFNNFWHGENSREENRAQHLVGLDFLESAIVQALVMPDPTKKFGIDVSHWNIPPVAFQRMKDLYGLQFVIAKGVDGSLNARYYPDHIAGAKAAGLPFGMYVWLYPNSKVSIDAQVNAWYARYIQDIPPLGIFIDAEWTTYGGQPANPLAADLRAAHDKWKQKSGKSATTYTAPGYANQYLTGFDWSREDLWIAHYGVQIPQLPKGAITYAIHQFTSTLDGKRLDPNGNYELDGNYWNDGTLPIPPDPSPAPIIDGYQKLRRNNADVHLWHGIPSQVHITDNAGALIRPSSYYQPDKPHVIINGDGWAKTAGITYHKPLSLAYSDGDLVQDTQYDLRPFFNASKLNYFSVDHRLDFTNHYNLVSGTRYLVRAGENFFAGDTDPEHITELNPRTALGYTVDGKLIACVVDGRSTISAGVTLRDLATILIEAGAWYALELDGGDSSIMLLGGIKVSANGDPINGVRTERATVNSVLIFTEEVNPMNGIAKEALGNVTTIRATPSRYGADTGKRIAANSVIEFVKIADVVVMGSADNVNDKWLELTDGNFVNYILSGKQYYTILTQPTDTPPPNTTHTVDVWIDGVNIYHKDLD